jgi:hypothetical protein
LYVEGPATPHPRGTPPPARAERPSPAPAG